MRHWLCALALLMSTSAYPEPSNAPSGIESVSWLAGNWKGSLGPQSVEETWSLADEVSMDALVRLSTPDGVQMIELIVIREVQAEDGKTSLVLHLRQFSPALELRASQDMRQEAMGAQSVSFAGDETAAFSKLSYTRTASDHLQIDVTTASGEVLSAKLQLN